MSCYSRAKLNLVRRDFSTAFETGLTPYTLYWPIGGGGGGGAQASRKGYLCPASGL